jgi:ribosomal protein S25
MKDKLWWVKSAIRSYLKTHERVDSHEIVSYMKVRCDITLTALRELIEGGKIERHWNGRYYELRLLE